MKQPAQNPQLRVLHLEDDLLDAEMVKSMLESMEGGCKIQRVEKRDEFQAALTGGSFDLIISDHTLPSYDGKAALGLARTLRPATPFIFFSGTIGEDAAIESLRNGATDYVLKQRPDRLVAAVRRAITEAREREQRREAEDRLNKSEERFRMFMGHSPSLAFIKDEAGRYVFLNQRMEDHFELSSPEMLGRTDFELLPADAARQLQEHDSRVFATGKPLEVVEIIPTPDGSWRHFLVSKFLLPGETGQRLLGGVAIDITQRLKDEQQMRELATMVDHAQDAICVIDWQQHVLYWNHSAGRLYEWPHESALGQNISGLFFPARPEEVVMVLEHIKDDGEWSGELVQKTRSGRSITVQSRWTLLRDERCHPKSILIINTDVTEQKLMELRFLRGQRIENIGALAGGIAHDLNNVLTPILMAADLLRGGIADPGNRKLLEIVRASSERGAGMVQQILSFARGLSGEHTPLNIERLVDEMASLAHDTFPKSIRIEVTAGQGVAMVKGDATQLHQVLLNLSINARDAMPLGGLLKIDLANVMVDQAGQQRLRAPAVGRYVRIRVSDTGLGMPPELLTRIFEPFFTTKETGKGTGLGLSTVNVIIKSHNGVLEVDSKVNQGTVFDIYLPSTETVESLTQVPASGRSLSGNGELILLVDDEAAILEINKTTLESFDYAVLTARNGMEAMALYEQNRLKIRLVLTDMMMPVMDGFTLVQRLRELDPETKIVCLTGFASHTRLGKIQELHTQGLLNKPYTMEQLLLSIRAVINPAQKP
ncbi:MAG TPA: response regulator [Roseimicrobium sp.]|nr:response regulator [Roseimicrobium sp.]